MSRLLAGLGAVCLVVLAGLLVSATGIVRMRASSGHWSITEELLRFSMRRSVATWSSGIQVPPLDDPDLLLIGAGHYEGGCRPCHGGPGLRRQRVTLAMLPDPPPLVRSSRDWDTEDLFYVVKHGFKFTGMPAFPEIERDDEIWATVAFLRTFPQLDHAGYRALVFGDTLARLREVPYEARQCVRCHGADGLGRGVFPRLAGQRWEYLDASLRAYLTNQRKSGIMQVAIDGLQVEEIESVARWFAQRPAGPPWRAPAEADLARGEAIAHGEVAGIPACVECHGPIDRPRNPVFPRLEGQDPDYLANQLALFRRGVRGGTAYAHLMEAVAGHGLDDEQIRQVTAWYATLPLEPLELREVTRGRARRAGGGTR